MSFPINPTPDQTYVTALGTAYHYVEADTAWKIIGVQGGGGGTITGTGTAHYLPVWTSATDMTSSCVYQSDATTYLNYNTPPVAVDGGTFTPMGSGRFTANNGLLSADATVTVIDTSDYYNPDTGYYDAFPVAYGHVYGSFDGGSQPVIQAVFMSNWSGIGIISSEGAIVGAITDGNVCIYQDQQTLKIMNRTGVPLVFGWAITFYPGFTLP